MRGGLTFAVPAVGEMNKAADMTTANPITERAVEEPGADNRGDGSVYPTLEIL